MRLTTKAVLILCAFGLLITGFTFERHQKPNEKLISLFGGETLDGWQAGENPETFSVEEGKIVVDGPRAHLFYMGPLNDNLVPADWENGNNFKNFEFKADVMTTEGSNSGIYFHTEYQKSGWPSKGYEAQINNTYQGDPRRTASLYGIDDIRQAPAADNEWFTMYIKVKGKQITIKVDGETMVDYTEPADVDRDGRILSSGTFALQGHDPESKVYYKNIKIKPL